VKPVVRRTLTTALRCRNVAFKPGDEVFETSEELVHVAETILESLPTDDYPYLIEMVEHALQPGYAFANEYEVGA
jgi:hypothetical protein